MDLAALLTDWRNFYGIIGSAAATLTGLSFVVLALAPERPLQGNGLRVYMAPTVVHFGTALAIAAILSMPGHGDSSLAACLCVGGVAGMLHGFFNSLRMYRSRGSYTPAVSDWIWNSALPCLCYLALLDSAALLVMRAPASLYLVGATALVLIFIGIRNLWDMALWLITRGDQP